MTPELKKMYKLIDNGWAVDKIHKPTKEEEHANIRIVVELVSPSAAVDSYIPLRKSYFSEVNSGT